MVRPSWRMTWVGAAPAESPSGQTSMCPRTRPACLARASRPQPRSASLCRPVSRPFLSTSTLRAPVQRLARCLHMSNSWPDLCSRVAACSGLCTARGCHVRVPCFGRTCLGLGFEAKTLNPKPRISEMMYKNVSMRCSSQGLFSVCLCDVAPLYQHPPSRSCGPNPSNTAAARFGDPGVPDVQKPPVRNASEVLAEDEGGKGNHAAGCAFNSNPIIIHGA